MNLCKTKPKNIYNRLAVNKMRKQLPKISEEDNLELENMPLNTKDESILVEPQVIKILPVILDACCGGRMFWFNKKHPSCIYIDQRVAPKGHYKEKPNHSVEPDIVMDFREMDFPDNTFKLVVFDPPHLATLGKTSKFAKDYGKLDKSTWRDDLRRGFDECWRVLDDYGVLIFKWNEYEISKKDVLAVIGKQPLFGHPVGSKVQTHWFTFMKIPDRQNSL